MHKEQWKILGRYTRGWRLTSELRGGELSRVAHVVPVFGIGGVLLAVSYVQRP